MYPIIDFFGVPTSAWTLLVTIGLLAALFSCNAMAIKRKFSVKLQRLLIVNFIITIVVAVFGAMLFQAFYDYIKYGTFDLFNSGLTFYGGFIFGVGAFLGVWFLGGKLIGIGDEVKQRFSDMADIAACVIPMAHGFGRIGCFLGGCCHGAPTSEWYGVFMHTETGYQKVVPVQLYEAIVLFMIAGVLFWLFFKGETWNKKELPLLPLYTISYGVWRFLIEYARTDDRGSLPILTFLSPSQLTALILIAAGGVYLWIWYKTRQKQASELQKNESDSDAVSEK